MALVSVIIPIFNKERFLEETIKSVLNQSFKNFELILIDDGSVDDSAKIAMYYRKADSRVKFHKQTNSGVSKTRNKGIELAVGKYISFLDADDKWNLNFLERMTNKINDLDACYCGHSFISNGINVKVKQKYCRGEMFLPYINNVCTPNTNCWLLRKSYIIRNNISFSEGVDWGEDMIFFSKVLLHSSRVEAVKQNLTEYHLRKEGSLSENGLDKINQHKKWMNILLEYIYTTKISDKRKKIYTNAIKSYRFPAGIVYRLLNNIDLINSEILIDYYKKNEKYIDNISLSNGLRSIKLYYYSLILRIEMRKRSLK